MKTGGYLGIEAIKPYLNNDLIAWETQADQLTALPRSAACRHKWPYRRTVQRKAPPLRPEPER